jgi:hypothetical protein
MKKALCLISALLFYQFAFCQNFIFDLYTGYGFYALKDLKDYQLEMVKSHSPLSIEAVEKFPSYFNYSFSFEYILNAKNIIGVNAAFCTTGGRNHLADYSGQYKFDMIINGYRIGFQYRNIHSIYNKIGIYGQIRSGSIFSVLKTNESFIVNNVDPLVQNQTFNSISYFGEPSFGILYSIRQKILIDVSIGYQFDTNGKFHLKKDKNIELKNASGESVFVNWSGFRISLGLSFDLFKKINVIKIQG